MRQKSKLDWALAHAQRGFKVFPLRAYDPDTDDKDGPDAAAKKPGLKNWRNLATTDQSQIHQWWSARPNANIGIQTDNLLVVDIDVWKGGAESFEVLTLSEDFPKTARSKSQSGGDHIMYQLPDQVIVRGGANKLAQGIDIKSWGGYMVAPGSTIADRAYEWGNTRAPSPAPTWLIERLKLARAKSKLAGTRVVEEDETAIALAENWLATRAPDAEIGERGYTAYKVAAKLYNFGVSRETCAEMLTDWTEQHCFPPMDASDVEHAADSALNNAQKPHGSEHPNASQFDPVEIEPRKIESATPIPPATKGLHYLTFKDSAAHATENTTEPLIEGLLDCGTMSVVYGESGSGKSFTELDKDFHIAAGEPYNGRPVTQGAVVYVAAEGGAAIHKRIAALAQHYKRDDVPLYVIPCPVDLLRADADLKPLVAMVEEIEQKAGKVLKLTLDTLSRVIAGGDENSPVDMGALVKHFDAIRSRLGVHLTVIHHTGKDRARGARGHSLLRAATDTEIEVGDNRITVTKQRDMEQCEPVRFGLRPARVGLDKKGRDIVSCYVELRQKGDLAEPAPLTGDEELFANRIVAYLRQKYPDSAENLYGSTFYVREAAALISNKNLRQKDASRMEATRQLEQLEQKGWVKKVQRGQWLWTIEQNEQNEQTS